MLIPIYVVGENDLNYALLSKYSSDITNEVLNTTGMFPERLILHTSGSISQFLEIIGKVSLTSSAFIENKVNKGVRELRDRVGMTETFRLDSICVENVIEDLIGNSGMLSIKTKPFLILYGFNKFKTNVTTFHLTIGLRNTPDEYKNIIFDTQILLSEIKDVFKDIDNVIVLQTFVNKANTALMDIIIPDKINDLTYIELYNNISGKIDKSNIINKLVFLYY